MEADSVSVYLHANNVAVKTPSPPIICAKCPNCYF